MTTPAVGITLFDTDRTIPPADLAREVEGRGFESLFLPEHSHIPVSRLTRWPGAVPGNEELPDVYWHLNDQVVALAMAAAVTTDLVLGTSVTLVPQHDPIWLAKQIATLDALSGGRVVLGIGFGWNREQSDGHGVPFAERRELTREHIELMRALWTEDVASYDGRYVRLEPSRAYPKPAQPGGPPILLGGGWGPKLFDAVCQYGDGWMPISARSSLAERLTLLKDAADRHGRDPASLQITVMGGPEDPAAIESLGAEGIDRVILTVWEEDPTRVLATLDRFQGILEDLG